MSGELLSTGDPVPHRHELPAIPTDTIRLGECGPTVQRERVNAVARCGTCGQLFVSRLDPEGWGRLVYWARLRWWHRAARRNLRGQSVDTI